MNELDELRDWHAEVPRPDIHATARARQRLLSEACAAPPVRSRRRILLPVAGLALALAATAGVLATRPDSQGINTEASSPRQLKMVSTGVVKVLGQASDHVSRVSVAPPRADQWIYERKLISVGTTDGLSFNPVEVWLRADGTQMKRSDRPSVLDSDGRPLTDSDGVMNTRPDGAESDDPTPLDSYAEVANWPTNPGQLLAGVSNGELASERGRARAFLQLAEALRDAPLMPAAQHAAIFQALAMIPGVQVQEAKDVAGREGLAIGRQDVSQGVGGSQGQRYEIILAPGTYEYLGDRILALGDVPAGTVHDGNILNASARLTTGIVDGPNVRP